MQLKIQQSELHYALSMTAKAINSTPVVPMFGNYHITEQRVSACDGQLHMSKAITAEGAINIAVSAIRLAGLIKDLPEQQLTLDAKDGVLTIKAFSGQYQIPYEPGEDFPKMDIKGKAATFTVDADELLELFGKTSYAVNTNELYPAQCGTSIQVTGNVLEVAATNMMVLAVFHLPITAPDLSIIIPAKAIKALSEASGSVDIEVYKSNVLFSFADVVIKARLIDERYPDYRAITPKEQPYKLSVDRAELIASLRRVTGFANKQDSRVALDIAADTLTITGEDIDFAEKATEVIKIDSTGVERIGVNGKLLIQSLSVLDSRTVDISFEDAKRCMVIVCENGYVLVMPMVIS